MMYKHLEQLSVKDIAEAIALWSDGFDTDDIADALGTRPSIIYNNLPRWRRALSSARAA